MRRLFSGIFAAMLALTLVTTAEANSNSFGPLISADALNTAQSSVNPFILDIRGDKVEDGFIPGAISVGYGAFRGPSENPGQLVTEDHLTALFQRLGLEVDRPTVVVYQGANETDFGAAARVYWTLKSAGVSQLAILNGGMNAWTEDSARTLDASPATPTPSTMTVTFSDEWLATREDVVAMVDGNGDARLIDARPEEFYNGKKQHPAAARPGTLPQSEYFTHSSWFPGGPAIIDAASARKLADENGFKQSETLVSFCNTGHWAATNWFALSELAEIETVKLYPESLVGWSHAGLPMDNTPGVLENLMDTLQNAVQ